MAKEYIEREAVLDALYDNEYTTLCPLDEVSSVIDKLPAADVVEVVRGRWKFHNDGSGTCDQCHFTQKHIYDDDGWQNFCGVCGADMRELHSAIPNMSPATKKLYDDVMESLTREDGDNNAAD